MKIELTDDELSQLRGLGQGQVPGVVRKILESRLSSYQDMAQGKIHNHMTRDIKLMGECLACDKYHIRQQDTSDE